MTSETFEVRAVERRVGVFVIVVHRKTWQRSRFQVVVCCWINVPVPDKLDACRVKERVARINQLPSSHTFVWSQVKSMTMGIWVEKQMSHDS